MIQADLCGMAEFRPWVEPTNGTKRREMEAARELCNNRNIIFKSADKGSKIIIMDKQQYILEANRQLANTKHYIPIKDSIQKNTQIWTRAIVDKLYSRKYITVKQRDFLYRPEDPRNRQFYLLPKSHKDPQTWTHVIPPGRPIVSDCSSAAYNVSLYIDQFLGPFLQTPQLFERYVSFSRTNQTNETPDKHTFIHNRH